MHRTTAPGRVNLIGDHTDYTGGLVLPMAIDLATSIEWEESDRVRLTSSVDSDPVDFDPRASFDSSMTPRWGRYVAAVASLMESPRGFVGRVSTTLPVGAGLASSAALEIAVALAMGFEGDAIELARMCQRAEHLATGVPTGIMDQMCIASARRGTATLIDCSTLAVRHVSVPEEAAVLVQFIAHRTLEGSEYSTRVAECARAESEIGPLRVASLDDAARISDPIAGSRARHVISENHRVGSFAAALEAGDLARAGALMTESHRSLAGDFAVSTPTMDAAVAQMLAVPGVFGARMTGGGFGGCIVALIASNAEGPGWRVHPSAGPDHA